MQKSKVPHMGSEVILGLSPVEKPLTSDTNDDQKKISFKGCRKIAFTVFSTLEEPPIWNDSKMIYLVAGREFTEDNKLHWQCFVIWKDAHTMSANAKQFMNAHSEPAFSTDEQNVMYCKKGLQSKQEWIALKNAGLNYGLNALIFEHGKLPIQGQRIDLIKAKDMIMNGETTIDKLIDVDPTLVHQYGRTLERIEAIHQRSVKRTEMTKCIWITGSTGTGKSHTAYEYVKDKTYYTMPNDNGWFDGYRQEEIFIMNDFRAGQMKYEQLLQLVDKWDYSLKRRGREPIPFISKLVIITSILTPQECYEGHLEHSKDGIGQLLRRITELINLDDKPKDDLKILSNEKYNVCGQKTLKYKKYLKSQPLEIPKNEPAVEQFFMDLNN